MAGIDVQQLRKVFGSGERATVAIDDISFQVDDGEFVSIVGPSGCGKSTLLNVVCGVEPPTSGNVVLGDGNKPVRIGYVFQEPRLLPWRRVIDNVVYVQSIPREEARRRARRYLNMVGLEDAADMWPGQLSGGMQQRVGIARALSVDPDLLLMDEPFSHLDAITARSLRGHLQEIWLQAQVTVLFVTHDIAEAVQLSDRIVVLEQGGRVRETVPIDLARPRRPSDTRLATLQAEIVGRFDNEDDASDGVAAERSRR